MDRAFHQYIDRIAGSLASDDIAQVRRAAEELETLSAALEARVRRAWEEWRAAGGPIGMDRMDLMAQRSMVRALLRDFRAMEEKMGLSLKMQDGKVKLFQAAARHTPGALRLNLADVRAEMSHREIREAIINALVEEDGAYYYWPVDVYSDRVIYEAGQRGDNVTEIEKLYRRAYVLNDDDTVTLGAKTEVKRETVYVDAARIQGGKLRITRKPPG